MPRRYWWGLVVVAAVVLLVQLPGSHATGWHFFELAADLLTGNGPPGDRGGLRLYGDHPELQFGPLSILVALPFTLLGSEGGEVAVMVAGSLLGLGVVRLVLVVLSGSTPPTARPFDRPTVREWVIGIVLVIVWGDIAVRTTHVDDAIALAAIAAGLVAVRRGQAIPATLLLAVAAAAKPWAVMFVPLCALPIRPGSWRRAVVAAGAAVATWLPFILAEPDTLDTSGFEIINDPTSSLRAFGIDAASTPGWIRPAQLVGGFAIVAVLVACRRWPGAILAGISWRLLLDPGVHRYYTAGFVIGALLVEDHLRPGRPPWITVVAAAILEVTAVPDVAVGPGRAARLAVLVIALGVATAAGAPRVSERV
jgi:hypothetical protein